MEQQKQEGSRVASAQASERPKTDKSRTNTAAKLQEAAQPEPAPVVIEIPKPVEIKEVKKVTPKPTRPRDKLKRLDDTMASTFYENE